MSFSALGVVLPIAAFAVTANNVFVTVSSSTAGVEGIFPVGGDFYVTTRGVTNPPFRADIDISANSPYYLVKPSSGRMNLTMGGNEEYRVRDESGAEDSFTGRVYVVKIEIEPKETNVCWKASSCKLKLTDDSVPGGVAVWTSSPGGISGSGNSITFNPSALSAGEYTVTVKSSIVPSYTDTCIVRIIKPVITTPNEGDVRLFGEEIKFAGAVEPSGLADVQFAWNVEQGVCNPMSSSTQDFQTTLGSVGDVKVLLKVTIGSLVCSTNRTVKSVRPEVTQLSWNNDHALTKWGGMLIVDPVWVKNLGGAVLTDAPGVYTKNASAAAELFISASNELTQAVSVQVRGVGDKENFYSQGAVFHRWIWMSGELVLSSSPLYNSVNYYDRLEICWQYCVKKLSGGWGDWVDMNSSSHVLYTVDSTPAASPLYDLGVDKACRYANGSAKYAEAINSGFAGEIHYDPSFTPHLHDLNIFSVKRGECCCHAYVLSLLFAHVTSEHPSIEYCWGGCANDTICRFNVRRWPFGPSFRCQRPAVDSAETNPHFLFHVEVPFKGNVYDPAYGLTGWASMLELAPAITNKHPNKSEFQSGQNFPPSKIHRVDWDCGH